MFAAFSTNNWIIIEANKNQAFCVIRVIICILIVYWTIFPYWIFSPGQYNYRPCSNSSLKHAMEHYYTDFVWSQGNTVQAASSEKKFLRWQCVSLISLHFYAFIYSLNIIKRIQIERGDSSPAHFQVIFTVLSVSSVVLSRFLNLLGITSFNYLYTYIDDETLRLNVVK